MPSSDVIVLSTHKICPRTGFCERCGNHEEYIDFYRVLCAASENTVAISHLRHMAVAQAKTDKIVQGLNEAFGKKPFDPAG